MCGAFTNHFMMMTMIMTIDTSHNTRSSLYIALIKPSSSLKVTRRSFRHASLQLWHKLPI